MIASVTDMPNSWNILSASAFTHCSVLALIIAFFNLLKLLSTHGFFYSRNSNFVIVLGIYVGEVCVLACHNGIG